MTGKYNYYEEIMKRVKVVVEERLHVDLEYSCTADGINVSLDTHDLCFEAGIVVHYRDIERSSSEVLNVAEILVSDYFRQLNDYVRK